MPLRETLAAIFLGMSAMPSGGKENDARPPVAGAVEVIAGKGAQWITSMAQPGDDAIQQAARGEGYFIDSGKPAPQLYSSKQAIECLRTKRVVFAGDSYSKQAFIGLVDVLTGEASNTEIRTGHARVQELLLAQKRVHKHLHPQGIRLTWQCSAHWQCYGETGNLKHCVQCLHELSADAILLSTGIHLLNHVRKTHAEPSTLDQRARAAVDSVEAAAVMNETQRAFHGVHNLIWGTAPTYMKARIPEPYRETMPLSAMEHVYHRTLALVAATHGRVKLVDFHRMTGSCVWENCTVDGGHRARFVNRGKAQAILALLCPRGDRVR
mmetsp:Transcript_2853/g.6789  ORF Transcript_2853/g.6789 Transcript_2853/m.6789 type:complete len:324 (+) Transcript_2853:414-1385(+)|eukprot:CAMPEP_0182931564 /NCGR_PEP_ID=MMETSP0105_2-20130417/28812_1 /TAXON_ID=81532 ORGANISM="Acanthoeca-like sp., Strain 10tr" /NCGR_SAMPLE_ID=MMETSP0105_2 /ASSEMBLY_ACC=CAM_ASM_000205 /LENGTH=323 /DNA_ID=CAMNT_0025070019 /DNA_START=317 /DNA_END=1288 /DNA_ORIENTATION=+